MWARPGTTCAYVDSLGIHGRYKFPVCVYCSVLPSVICMTMERVSGLIFLSGYPGRIKLSVASSSSMASLLSIFILYVLNRVSFFEDYMLSME